MGLQKHASPSPHNRVGRSPLRDHSKTSRNPARSFSDSPRKPARSFRQHQRAFFSVIMTTRKPVFRAWSTKKVFGRTFAVPGPQENPAAARQGPNPRGRAPVYPLDQAVSETKPRARRIYSPPIRDFPCHIKEFSAKLPTLAVADIHPRHAANSTVGPK